MSSLGLPELLLVLGVAVLLFGGKKLPQLGGAIGESIKNFKKGLKDGETIKAETEAATRLEQPPASVSQPAQNASAAPEQHTPPKAST